SHTGVAVHGNVCRVPPAWRAVRARSGAGGTPGRAAGPSAVRCAALAVRRLAGDAGRPPRRPGRLTRPGAGACTSPARPRGQWGTIQVGHWHARGHGQGSEDTMMKQAAQPTRLGKAPDPRAVEKLLEWRRKGAELRVAASIAGVHVATVCRWQNRDP